jgi:hypothetical protein
VKKFVTTIVSLFLLLPFTFAQGASKIDALELPDDDFVEIFDDNLMSPECLGVFDGSYQEILVAEVQKGYHDFLIDNLNKSFNAKNSEITNEMKEKYVVARLKDEMLICYEKSINPDFVADRSDAAFNKRANSSFVSISDLNYFFKRYDDLILSQQEIWSNEASAIGIAGIFEK